MRSLLLLAALAGLLPGRAPAAVAVPDSPELPARLDLEQALRLLRERGLDLLTAEAAVAAATGDAAVASELANPTLSAGYGRSFPRGACVDAAGAAIPCSPLPDPALSASVSDDAAIWSIVTGKRGLRVDVARRALEAARLSRDDALRNLEGQVEQQFVALVLARDTLAFAREVAEAQARTQALSEARLDAGAISEADLARIETARLEADQQVDAAAAGLRGAQVALAYLLGVRGPVPDFDVEGGPLERSTPPPGLAAETRATLVRAALDHRPDVAAARRQEEGARAALDLARRERIPDVSLSLGYAQQGTTNQALLPPTWTVGISLPLPVLSWQRGEVAKAEATLVGQSLARARAESTAVSEVEGAWATLEASRSMLARMEGRLLDRSRRAFDLVTVQYDKGAASLLDLLDARRTWIGVRLEYLGDLAAYWQAIFRLEQAAGVKLR